MPGFSAGAGPCQAAPGLPGHSARQGAKRIAATRELHSGERVKAHAPRARATRKPSPLRGRRVGRGQGHPRQGARPASAAERARPCRRPILARGRARLGFVPLPRPEHAGHCRRMSIFAKMKGGASRRAERGQTRCPSSWKKYSRRTAGAFSPPDERGATKTPGAHFRGRGAGRGAPRELAARRCAALRQRGFFRVLLRAKAPRPQAPRHRRARWPRPWAARCRRRRARRG